MMVLTNPCCCNIVSFCCCIPPTEIQANTMSDGSGTFTVIYTYQSTTFATICGGIVAFHVYHHISGSLPGYLSGVEYITLSKWCSYPSSDCMSEAGVPSYNYPPTSADMLLYKNSVTTIYDLSTTIPLDIISVTCNCGAFYHPTGVQWRWDTAIDFSHTDSTYQSSCPDLFHYRMTHCEGSDGVDYDAYNSSPIGEGTVWFDGSSCFTANYQAPVSGAVPFCGLISEVDCNATDCAGETIFTYRLNQCFGLGGVWYFSSTDVIPDGTAACCIFSSTPPMGDPLTVAGVVHSDATASTSTLTSYRTASSCVALGPCV